MKKNMMKELLPLCLVVSMNVIACSDKPENEDNAMNNQNVLAASSNPTDSDTQQHAQMANEAEQDEESEFDEITVDHGESNENNIVLEGEPTNYPKMEIDPNTAEKTILDNVTHHINHFESTVGFLETSSTLETIYSMIPSAEEEDSELSLDFSDVRDRVLILLEEHIFITENSTSNQDYTELIYHLDPEDFCISHDIDENESEADRAERIENSKNCMSMLVKNPVSISLTSLQKFDIEAKIHIGEDNVEALRVQVFDDRLSVYTELSHLRSLIEMFVSPEDFALPSTFDGAVYGELRKDSDLVYTAQFSVLEAINIRSDNEQENYVVNIPKMLNPAMITIDGNQHSLQGELQLEELQVALPWQHIVDMFYDDEVQSETICEVNPETGESICWDQWVEPPSPPAVEESFGIEIPEITGAISYTSKTDIFTFQNIGLGPASTMMYVERDPIIQVDLNPDQNRALDFHIFSPESNILKVQFASMIDTHFDFNWHHVSNDIKELPSFLMNETLGLTFFGDNKPALVFDINNEEETEKYIESGTLHLWSSNMEETVVVNTGECITSVEDTESDTETHELFGDLVGKLCLEE